jgi:hypothetical protein
LFASSSGIDSPFEKEKKLAPPPPPPMPAPFYENEREDEVSHQDEAADAYIVKSGSSLRGAVKVLPGAFVYGDTAQQKENFLARQREKDRLAEEISRGLESVSQLANEHVEKMVLKLRDNDEHVSAASGATSTSVEVTSVEKVHTLKYRPSVLESSGDNSASGSRKSVSDVANGESETRNEESNSDKDKTAGVQLDSAVFTDDEHTYANLGVAFVELTEKIKSVVTEMSNSSAAAEDEDDATKGKKTPDIKEDAMKNGAEQDIQIIDDADLPYIDDDDDEDDDDDDDDNGNEGLENAIWSASGLDRVTFVDRVELISLPERPSSFASSSSAVHVAPAASPELMVGDMRRTEGTNTIVQSCQGGGRIIIRRDLADV